VGVVGTFVAALLIVAVPKFEGGLDETGGSTGYRDAAGIPTKCNGDTHNVVVGKYYTSAECKESLETQLIAHSEGVLNCTPQLKTHFYQLAAAVSFAYNIGVPTYCQSTTAKRFRAGDYKGACKAMNESDTGKPQWVYITVKNPTTGVKYLKQLPGLVERRKEERTMCETELVSLAGINLTFRLVASL